MSGEYAKDRARVAVQSIVESGRAEADVAMAGGEYEMVPDAKRAQNLVAAIDRLLSTAARAHGEDSDGLPSDLVEMVTLRDELARAHGLED